MFEADTTNSQISPTLMAELHPWAVTAFDDTADLFGVFYDEFANWSGESEVDEKLRAIAKVHGLSDDELVRRIQSGTAGNIEGAEALFARLWTLRIIKVLLAACQRYWAWGAGRRLVRTRSWRRSERGGMAEAGFFPSVIYYFGGWFPMACRGRAVSRIYVASSLASVVMGAISSGLLRLWHGVRHAE